VGKEALQVDSDRFGFYDDEDKTESGETNNGKKKEQQFLTNEERMKGMLLTNESMVPAVTQFRGALGDAGNREFAVKIANYLFFKKRFQGREVQITSHLKPSVVPGFNAMLLDDSEADQTVLAYCSSVTHRIYATQGGYTNVQLTYARTIEEQDLTAGSSSQPLVPPWFDEAIFGSVKDGELKVTEELNNFYKDLLGDKAYQSITGYAKKDNIVSAVKLIREEYLAAKSKGPYAVSKLIQKTTQRDYIKMNAAFSFIGGKTKTEDETLPFLEYLGIKQTDMDKKRKDTVLKYRNTLKNNRGFRG